MNQHLHRAFILSVWTRIDVFLSVMPFFQPPCVCVFIEFACFSLWFRMKPLKCYCGFPKPYEICAICGRFASGWLNMPSVWTMSNLRFLGRLIRAQYIWSIFTEIWICKDRFNICSSLRLLITMEEATFMTGQLKPLFKCDMDVNKCPTSHSQYKPFFNWSVTQIWSNGFKSFILFSYEVSLVC